MERYRAFEVQENLPKKLCTIEFVTVRQGENPKISLTHTEYEYKLTIASELEKGQNAIIYLLTAAAFTNRDLIRHHPRSERNLLFPEAVGVAIGLWRIGQNLIDPKNS